MKKYRLARWAINDNVIHSMRVARWVTKATDTHSEYVILIAFPRKFNYVPRSESTEVYLHPFVTSNMYKKILLRPTRERLMGTYLRKISIYFCFVVTVKLEA
jgi:hypothetical protein